MDGLAHVLKNCTSETARWVLLSAVKAHDHETIRWLGAAAADISVTALRQAALLAVATCSVQEQQRAIDTLRALLALKPEGLYSSEFLMKPDCLPTTLAIRSGKTAVAQWILDEINAEHHHHDAVE